MKKIFLLGLSLAFLQSCSTDDVNKIQENTFNLQENGVEILKEENNSTLFLRNYTLMRDGKGNFIIKLNTTEPVNVAYTTKEDGTNVITIRANSLGETSFSKNFGNASKKIKYEFAQQDGSIMRNEPGGTTFP